ncbi:efflux transporter outer membrane subunit [Pseudomonas fluorescens]|uniref:TolC family protein n=1 Tax=Pseudomonas fluorescens TaxID=294 RepID=A0A944HHY5_PSEFL|nr:TolC family protein [Pseudomonas fluorescens]MBT2297365.1 TolC family protein [Pseudomonas fluorescens]MBT2305563.1 TolC family protein [Pseudomonas fluorescens]MBT2314414.1 TolC family protein [Pseudomonas fluorescens]MBT2319094.1 TolC family protein [Pseudomonas fluorescens]MBT2328633.1 TolC family protein [Pseudomonas fluorescens]
MSPLHPAALILSASLMAGCAVGPDYHRPDTALSDRFLGQPSVQQRSATMPASLIAWWEGFDDPALTEFVAKALEQNLDLAQASARVAQARAGLGAANAALLPSGNISGQAARAYQSVETPLGQALNSTPGYDRYGSAYELNLGASWEVDLFGSLRRGREAALAEYQASTAGVAATRLAVAAQTADIYLTVRGLQTRLGIANQQVKTQQELLEKVQLLYSKGLAASYQVRQTEGALAQVQATVPVLQIGLDAAMNALDIMLGTPPGTHRTQLANAQSIPLAPQITAMGTPADLLRRRPDLIVAERRLAASNARIAEAVAEYYPKFSLSALLGSATAVSAGNLFTGGASQSAGVLGLRWRLFDFGRINAQIDQAKGQQAEALAAYRQSALRASEDVENAFSSLVNRQTQATTLTAAETALTQARQSSFIAYEKGTASLIDVLQADETLLRASDARAQARTESARAAVAAFRALGGGWQPSHAGPLASR